MRRDGVEPLRNREARDLVRHDERRKPFRAGRLAGAREHDIEIGDTAVGDPGLLAVEHIAGAVMLRRQFDIGDIGAGLRFGQRERGNHGAGTGALEPVALLRVAEQADRPGAEPLHGEREVAERIVPRQRFTDQAQRADVERGWRLGIGRGVLEPAVAAELLHQIAACGIDVAMVGRQVCFRPVLNAFRNGAVAVVKEWPVEERGIRHHLAPLIPAQAGIQRPPRICAGSPLS